MFTTNDLEQLAAESESDSLDFKAEMYDFSTDEGKTSFVKDVTAMANTPREGSGHIVLGIKEQSDGTRGWWGEIDHRDDAELQSLLTSRVAPVPRIRYHPVKRDGKDFGVIEILPEREGPYLPIGRETKRFRHPKLYFRQRSMIRDATSPTDYSRIQAWFDTAKAKPSTEAGLEEPAWDVLMRELESFDGRQNYLLVAPKLRNADPRDLSMFGRAPWTAVVDLDESSDVEGLLAAARPVLQGRRGLHIRLPGQSVLGIPGRAAYWYFALGTHDAPLVRPRPEQRNWFNQARRPLQDFLQQVAAASSPAPVCALVPWYDGPDHRLMARVIDDTLTQLGELAKVVIATDQPSEAGSVADEMDIPVVEITLHQLCSGLRAVLDGDETEGEGTLIPSQSGAPEVLDPTSLPWLREELEIVDLHAGESGSDGVPPGHSFLRGGEPSWRDLAARQDVERDTEVKLRERLETQLSMRRTQRINLYHRPGAGGTTLGRRLVWDFHRRFPSVLIQSTEPAETVGRLESLAQLTQLPVLALVDSADVPTAKADELYELLASRNVSIVILQVLRRFSQHKSGPQSFDLANELSTPESVRFADRLSAEAPGRRGALQALSRDRESKMRSAFYFGLVAFGEDFRGLQPFVGNRVDDLNETQRKIVSFLALAHHYAQQPLSAQTFATLVGIPGNRIVQLRTILGNAPTGSDKNDKDHEPPILDLLIEAGPGIWRTSHDLVATQVLHCILGRGLSDQRAWRNQLADCAVEFAELCCAASDGQSDQLLEILRRLFIYRDNTELLGTERSATRQFAQLLEDIPSTEGAARVLHRLTELFPEEPHFWAHLGRLYSIELHDYSRAISFIDQAISLNPDDGTLHHMKGMVLRQQLYEAMDHAADIDAVLPLAQSSSESFFAARRLNPDTEHGYISEVQMLARLLDYTSRASDSGLLEFLTRRDTDPFLRDSFARSEDLLEQVRTNRQGRSASRYEQECRASLDRLYGRHEKALEGWNNLLGRPDVYKPPVRRQLVWTYLARRDRSWQALSVSELERIADLLEKNLREEPDRETNLRLWLRAIRRLPSPPSLSTVVERVAYWHATSNSLESSYYLYVLYSLSALEGLKVSLDQSARFLEESKMKARYRANRTWSFEWVGPSDGISALVHQSELGEWLKDADFWENPAPLARIKGRITRIDGPHKGQILIAGGMRAFFIPGRGGFVLGRDENTLVDAYLGFSYDGPQAWQVEREYPGSADPPRAHVSNT